MPKPLVIVESPAKARTIAAFLGNDYHVESSVGHIRDLPSKAQEIPKAFKDEPWARLGVNVNDDFKPLYIVVPRQKENVKKLRGLLKDASELYLATDEDREGEAIAWHLLEALSPTIPVKRMVFHEITREAIERAIGDTRDLNRKLVDAQEARRILDRLYGWEVSEVLWKKISPRLSAGRVQSVATRLVVERERARMAFRSGSWWDVVGTFAAGGPGSDNAQFGADLIQLDGRRLAQGRDFDPATGQLSADANVVMLDEPAARGLTARLEGRPFTVASVESKDYTQRPSPPFITSTLQQEAGRKLRFSSARAMAVAQRLYERGFITYMRTDSTNLSEQAITAARSQIAQLYGPEYVPSAPRTYAKKVKNAQEAHEAIRPAGDNFRLPDQVRAELDDDEFRMYDLVWKRTVASQMADARGQRVTVRLNASTGQEEVVFQATGRTIEFPGFLRAYVEGSDDPDADLEDREVILPTMTPRPGRGHGRAAPRRPHHPAAGPLHRGQPGQGAGGAGHRPSVHLRLGHPDHPGPRLRLEEGHRARPVVDGLRGGPTARAALRGRWSTTTSRPAWRRTSTPSPAARPSRRPGSADFYFGEGGKDGERTGLQAHGARAPRRHRRPLAEHASRSARTPPRRGRQAAGRSLRALRAAGRPDRAPSPTTWPPTS